MFLAIPKWYLHKILSHECHVQARDTSWEKKKNIWNPCTYPIDVNLVWWDFRCHGRNWKSRRLLHFSLQFPSTYVSFLSHRCANTRVFVQVKAIEKKTWIRMNGRTYESMRCSLLRSCLLLICLHLIRYFCTWRKVCTRCLMVSSASVVQKC